MYALSRPHRFQILKMCIWATLFVLPLSISCTKSPFGESDISGGNTVLKGVVLLDTNEVAKNAIVYLDGLDLGTRTDANGAFSLELPPPATQGGQSGYTGTLDLYFYVGNYTVLKRRVGLRDGTFIYGSNAIDKDGKLADRVILNKLVEVEVRLQPTVIQIGETRQVRADITLSSQVDSITIYWPGTIGTTINPMVLTNSETGESNIISTTATGAVSGSDYLVLEATAPINRGVLIGSGYFPNVAAQFTVSPILLVRPFAIPEPVLTYLGLSGSVNLTNYQKIPFELETEGLTIIPDDNTLD